MTINCDSPAKTQADACTGKIYDKQRFFTNTYSEKNYCVPCITEEMIDQEEITSEEDSILVLERVAEKYNYKLLTYREGDQY